MKMYINGFEFVLDKESTLRVEMLVDPAGEEIGPITVIVRGGVLTVNHGDVGSELSGGLNLISENGGTLNLNGHGSLVGGHGPVVDLI